MGKASFNLIEEPWIPCVDPDGRVVEKGLLDTLRRAGSVRTIYDPSPLATASLFRLLLTILHRNFGPPDILTWQNIWKSGAFDLNRLEGYFQEWHHRFDLFDDVYPFYQVAEFPARSKTVAAALLRQELSGGNNPTLFDHTTDQTPVILDPPQAARLLLAFQNYGLGGLSGLEANFTDAPAARHVTFLVMGGNLFESLCLNLILYNDHRPFPRKEKDQPAWEKETFDFKLKSPRGYLDYLSWQARAVRLLPGENNGEPGVDRIQLGLGREITWDTPYDPLTAWKKDEKRGYLALRFQEGKALWRDSITLFPQNDSNLKPPEALVWLRELKLVGVLSSPTQYLLNASGLGSDRGSIYFWRHERLPLPLAYLGDSQLIGFLEMGMDWTNTAAGAVRAAVWSLAGAALAPGERQADTEDIRRYVGHLDADALYWGRLEAPFYRFLVNLPHDQETALDNWLNTVIQTARNAYSDVLRDLNRSARLHRARVKSETVLNGKLKPLIDQQKKAAVC